eukprot:scaffold213_cov245-Pinguiococcus_pyrenoidosus.AAC.9
MMRNWTRAAVIVVQKNSSVHRNPEERVVGCIVRRGASPQTLPYLAQLSQERHYHPAGDGFTTRRGGRSKAEDVKNRPQQRGYDQSV